MGQRGLPGERLLAFLAQVAQREPVYLNPKDAAAHTNLGNSLSGKGQLNEAIVCYDRAIEADHSVTLAYLYKGGVFNRLERYNEALECYEQALKTQEKAHAA